jgi:hypothetical protein
VYRLVVEQGMSKENCYQALKADFPDLSRELVANALGRALSLLTPRQRWQINVRRKGRRPAGEHTRSDRVDAAIAPEKGPDAILQDQQEKAILLDALSRLSARQRLLLQLRFQQGLSLEKITQLQHLGDTSRTWRDIQAAKKALFDEIQQKKFGSKRKT